MKLQSFIQNDILVIAFKLPLTNMFQYDVYEMFPSPVPHAEDRNLYSYIEPSKPFILFSTTRTMFLTVNDLRDCQEYLPAQWLCEDMPPAKITTQELCQTQLFLQTASQIPRSCKVRSLSADLVIWHKLASNQWLFAISKPTQLTVVCHPSLGAQETPLHNGTLGILELSPDCKAYTAEATLEAQTSLGTVNLTHVIPTTRIDLDDCCVRLKENITLKHVHLEPIKFVNFDLQELKFAQHKLRKFDEQLEQQLNEPFIIQQSHWHTTALSIICGVVAYTTLYKLAKLCGLSNICKYLWCFKRKPQSSASFPHPCFQIFNQCYNKPERQRPINVHYDADIHTHTYDLPEIPQVQLQIAEESSPKGTLRRYQRLHPKINIALS